MKTKTRIWTPVFICLLLLSACAPPAPATASETSAPVSTATTEPTPTPRPERIISQRKSVRVSASWVVDPPARAVNGNLSDWWGAGGPAPQWIEVDLEGIYSVSKIRVINQGPTGGVPYEVFGRGPDHKTRLLHTFEGLKSENQVLEFSPATAWENISTIRIEINGGSGWVGLREIQVYSREDPKPLTASTELTSPSFLARVDMEKLSQITPDNAILLKQLAMLGRGTINELAWSPDGKTLAAVGTLGVWLYDPGSPYSPPRLLEGHTRDVLSIAFSADGKTVLSGSQDGTVRLWDVATGDLKRTISLWDDFSYEVGEQNRDKEVWSMAFSPDGISLATGAIDGTLRLWNLTTGVWSKMPKGHTASINNLAFSPDGKLLASSGADKAVLVWDVANKSQYASLPVTGQIQNLIFSPDSSILAYGGAGMTVQLWNAATGEERTELPEHSGVLSLAFSPDGSKLISSGLTGTMQFWDRNSGASSVFRERGGWVVNMAYSPDGGTLATYAWDGALRLWETETGSLSADLATHTSPVTSVAFSSNNRLIASGGENGAVRLWDVEANQLRTTLWGHVTSVSDVAVSPDGAWLISGGLDGTVHLWDVASGRQMAVFSGHEKFVRSVAFSPDGKTIASGSTDTTVRLWDVTTGKERAVLSGNTSEVESVAFSPDGLWLVSASADKTLRIWEVATGKESGILRGHLSFVLDAVFSPAGNLIASAGGDHGLRMWDWEVVSGKATGRHHFPPIGHPGWVLSVAFSPDAKIIAAANVSTTSYWVAPGEVHLYSADTGYPYALLRGHTRRVTSLAFSPDGKLLASGSADGSVRLWGVWGDGSPSDSSPTSQATPIAATSTPRPVGWDPFVGEWTATDPVDGSNITMTISGSEDGNYSITQIDDGSRGCGLDSAGKPKFGIKVVLQATAYGDTLNATSTSVTCLSTPPSRLDVQIQISFLYQAPTDTIWDDAIRVDWKRRK